MTKRPRSPSFNYPNGVPLPESWTDAFGEWREMPLCEGLWISSLGYKMHMNAVCGLRRPHMQSQDQVGYRWFTYNGKKLSMHFCVATVFHEPAPSIHHTPDHLPREDGDWYKQRGDNRKENLKWADKSEQIRNQTDRRRRADSRALLCRHVHWDDYTPNLLLPSLNDASSQLGANLSHITAILNGRLDCGKRRRTAKGWTFEYADSFEPQDDIIDPATGEVEEWKAWDENLLISSMGRVEQKVKGRWIPRRTPKPAKGSHYARVNRMMLHPMVCDLFCGPRLAGQTLTDHIDRDKSNNRASNLRPATHKQNVANRTQTTGNKNRAYAVLAQGIGNDTVTTYDSISLAAKDLGLSSGNISSCCSGKVRHVGNYTFKYA